jgi:hypothetical protein
MQTDFYVPIFKAAAAQLFRVLAAVNEEENLKTDIKPECICVVLGESVVKNMFTLSPQARKAFEGN